MYTTCFDLSWNSLAAWKELVQFPPPFSFDCCSKANYWALLWGRYWDCFGYRTIHFPLPWSSAEQGPIPSSYLCFISPIAAEKAQGPGRLPEAVRDSTKWDINMQQHPVRHILILVPVESYTVTPSGSPECSKAMEGLEGDKWNQESSPGLMTSLQLWPSDGTSAVSMGNDPECSRWL